MQNLIATTFEVVHYIALQAVHYKPLQEVHLSRYNHLIGPSRSTRRDYHPLAERQFGADLEALKAADTCVLVLPCGRSAHTEAGWMAGTGKRVIVYIPEMVEPELMYKLFDQVVDNLDNLVQCLCYDGEIKEG